VGYFNTKGTHAMRKKWRFAGVSAATMVVAAVMALPSVASAHTGEFSKFDNCPSTNTEVKKCAYSVVSGGEVVLGSKKVPIVNPVILQGGYGKAVSGSSPFFAATNGETLSNSPQPVPGGLAGLVNCKEINNFILMAACEWTIENGLTGLNSTVELAKPASEIKISELNLLTGNNKTVLQLPVKFHLENPFLGSNCYVGSSSNPVIWNLTSGTTAPPPPNEPISGFNGTAETLEEGEILKLNGVELVDNAWSAPGATGCGGPIVEVLLDPIINAASGLPAEAGHNTAVQEVTLYSSSAASVNAH
jgi:hypothetical protein